MSEHKPEQEDPYADLMPEPRQSERTRLVLSDRKFIDAARKRGNPWANIAKRFNARHGLSISADHLRVIVERYSDAPANKKANTKTTRPHQVSGGKAKASGSAAPSPHAPSLARPPRYPPQSPSVELAAAFKTLLPDSVGSDPPAARTTADNARSLPERL